MIRLEINGKSQTFDLPGEMPLLWTLRDEMGLTGTKFGCGMALCALHRPHRRSSRALLHHTDRGGHGQEDRHHRGGRHRPIGKALQERGSTWACPNAGIARWPDHVRGRPDQEEPKPTDADIDEAMSGNICRCGTYTRIRAAIKQVAAKQGGRDEPPVDPVLRPDGDASLVRQLIWPT